VTARSSYAYFVHVRPPDERIRADENHLELEPGGARTVTLDLRGAPLRPEDVEVHARRTASPPTCGHIHRSRARSRPGDAHLPTKADSPVIAMPTISEFISRVPS
jgi:hypothetical protein